MTNTNTIYTEADSNNNRSRRYNGRFTLEQLDQNKFIKENNLVPVTNSIMFGPGGGPTPDGLLSNEIFGITKDERAGIFSYIDLHEQFINPYYYKIWLKLDKNLRGCIYETFDYKLNPEGYLEQVDTGETGIAFLVKNKDKLNFKNTKKDKLLAALIDARDNNKLFTDKMVIIPPYYRDVNTNSSGKVGVGEINKLYMNLLNQVRALTESNEYGLSMSGGTRGRIQDILLEIYNWFTVGESVVGGEHTGAGIFKKFGVIRRSVMSKTTDYSARLVLSSPNINVNSKEDLMVDMNYSSIPLSAALVIAYPFIIYELRQFFNNEFGGKINYNYIDHDKLMTVQLRDPEIEFSDERFDKEINEYIHGYSNRIKAVELPCDIPGLYLNFKGYNITQEEYNRGVRETGTPYERHLTWVDLFYIAAVAATEDRMAVISRYPIDSHFNQLYTGMHISSTIETQPMVINGKLYKWYPKINEHDIGSDTSNKFIDTCSICNTYCGRMLADYDGDQVTVKMAYSDEVNREIKEHVNSTAQLISLNGTNNCQAEKEAIQAMYNLTLILPGEEARLTNPEF